MVYMGVHPASYWKLQFADCSRYVDEVRTVFGQQCEAHALNTGVCTRSFIICNSCLGMSFISVRVRVISHSFFVSGC